jgi:hypothetical protein
MFGTFVPLGFESHLRTIETSTRRDGRLMLITLMVTCVALGFLGLVLLAAGIVEVISKGNKL